MPEKLTRAEWMKSTDPYDLIEHMMAAHRVNATAAGKRRLVLFVAGCCRRGWKKLEGDPCQSVIEAAERFADKEITLATFERVSRTARKKLRLPGSWMEFDHGVQFGTLKRRRLHGFYSAIPYMANRDHADMWLGHRVIAGAIAGKKEDTELAVQADLVRDIFGNPFLKPPKFDKRWRTSTVLLLARQMYESREFSAMPILADALQDAGCNDATILDHCRGPGPHVCGCWVVDLVLGKK
jgi:hypothetical protein